MDQADKTGQIFGPKRAEKGFLTAKGPTDPIHQKVQIMELAESRRKNENLKFVNKKLLTLL